MMAMVRILIVDDDAEAAVSLLRMLQNCGHDETRVVRSATSALQLALEFDPGIIFVDVELPDLGGYEVASLVHQHPHRRLRLMRLIALTETAEHPARERARFAGFERYLVKPVSPSALREVLDVQ